MSNPVDDGKRLLIHPGSSWHGSDATDPKELAEKMGLSSRIVIEYEKAYCLYEPTPETVQCTPWL